MNLERRVVAKYLEVEASASEKEVERLLAKVLPGTEFAGKTKAVGGYVRDEFLGQESKDLDILVGIEGGAEKLTKYLHGMFGSAISTPRNMGASYPIWQITFKGDVQHDNDTFHTEGAVIEFADGMKESYPDPNSRQRVTQPASIDEDIKRRDFTVNMLLKEVRKRW